MKGNSPLMSNPFVSWGDEDLDEERRRAKRHIFSGTGTPSRCRQPSCRDSVHDPWDIPGDRPLKLGRDKDGAPIAAPGWLCDEVMPHHMPNGMAYSEMSTLVSLHVDEAAEFPRHMAESDLSLEDNENLAIWLYKSTAEQEMLMSWFREFLAETEANLGLACEKYPDIEEYKKKAWLFKETVEYSQYYGMSWAQLIKAVDDWFSRYRTAVDVGYGNDPFPGEAIFMYQSWMAGEEFLQVFKGILDGIIARCVELIAEKEKEENKEEGQILVTEVTSLKVTPGAGR